MFLKEIDGTAVVAWGPSFTQQPFIATGTVSGALDASFSTNSELSLFNVSLQERETRGTPVASVPCSARFNRLSWSPHEGAGIIAGGLEDGTICLWDAGKIINNQIDDALIDSKNIYGGPVRGLEFSPHTPFLLAIGSVDAQLSLMDMHDPSRVYMPGPSKSQRLEDISDLAWNPKVSHILAASSTNGITVVWDLRAKKEALQFSVSGQRGAVSSLSWNPDLPNQIVCACEDNASPVIYSWDLRNAHSPDKTFTGHGKGVLSVAWCPKDSELLLSSGKDNRVIFWNPKTASIIGELPAKDNWVFDVQWCPKNPDLLSTAGFDGKIDIYSFQTVSASLLGAQTNVKDDLFGAPATPSNAPTQPTTKQVPKWLKCPVGARFGFGGKLATFGPSTKKITISALPSDAKLGIDSAIAENNIPSYCAQHVTEQPHNLKSGSDEAVLWTVLKVLSQEDSKTELLKLAGVSLTDGTGSSELAPSPTDNISAISIPQPPSSTSAALADAGSFRPSLEVTPTSFAPPPNQDFFSGSATDEFDFLHGHTTETIEELPVQESDLKRRSTFCGIPFSLYSSDATPHDQRITHAIIAGNFREAVEQCISADRLSDALLVAACGGPDLVARTQRIYFQKVRSPYLRVVSGILKKDLSDVVENASVVDWQDLFGLILSFASESERNALLENLADRLALDSDAKSIVPSIVCYLVAGDIAKASALMLKQAKRSMPPTKDLPNYSRWLSSLMEKIRIAQLSNPSVVSIQSIIEQIPDLARFALHYAFLLSETGRIEEAAYYLSLIHGNIPVQQKGIAFFVDRVAGMSKNSALASIGKPFEIVTVPAEISTASQSSFQQPSSQLPSQKPYLAASTTQAPQTQPYPSSTTQAPIVPPSQPQYAKPSIPQPTQQPYQQPYPSYPQTTQPYPQPSISQQAPLYHQAAPQQPAPPPPQPYPQISQSQPYPQPTQSAYQQPSQPQPYSLATQQQPQQQSYSSYQPYAQPQAQPTQQQRPVVPAPSYPIMSSAPIASQPAAPSITAAEFSTRRTAEGFNDAPIVAPRTIAASRSPPAPMSSSPGGPSPPPPAAPMHPPPQPIAPEKKQQLGPPDPSKILPQHAPIYSSVTALVKACEQRASPMQRRSVDDASRRLQLLYSQLTYQALTDMVIQKLLAISQALNSKNNDQALHIVQELTTGHFAETGGWILGLRRLIELLRS